MKIISIDVINCHLTYGHSTFIHGLIIIMQNVKKMFKEGVKWPSLVLWYLPFCIEGVLKLKMLFLYKWKGFSIFITHSSE